MSKKSYSSRIEAYAATRLFAKRGWKQEEYECNKCGAWHLRTMVTDNKRNKRRKR